MGGISFLLFLVLTITGILLMFYYRPTVEHAYHDMKDLYGIHGVVCRSDPGNHVKTALWRQICTYNTMVQYLKYLWGLAWLV